MKTGASDSAWLRAVLEEVEDDSGRLLIVSEDKDIQAAFEQWQKPCPLILMRRRVHLKATMAEFILDDGGAENLIVKHLVAMLGDSSQDEDTLSLGIAASPGLERLIASSLAEHEPDIGLYEASLTRITGLAGITNTYVEASSAEETDQSRTSGLGPTSSQTALATVFFLADAEATVNRLYNGGEQQIDSLNYDDVLVRVPMSFDIQDGNSVVAVRSEDEATVFLPDGGYSDPGDAAAELRDALSVIPGLTLPETWPETTRDQRRCRSVHGPQPNASSPGND